MFELSFIEFNLVEGIFWVSCAIVTRFVLRRFHFMSHRLRYFLSADFVLFGMSDIVEAYYPSSFLDKGGEWLFVWKALCIAGFVVSCVWYAVERSKKST